MSPVALIDVEIKQSDRNILCATTGDVQMELFDALGRRLMWWGMVIFLLGLIKGLIQNNLANPRMGLSAHLEGLMNGTLLVAVGAIWSHIHTSSRALGIIYSRRSTALLRTGPLRYLPASWAQAG